VRPRRAQRPPFLQHIDDIVGDFDGAVAGFALRIFDRPSTSLFAIAVPYNWRIMPPGTILIN
jgi:hypothetical protein